MSVEAVNESLYGGFVDMSDVRCRLAGLLTSDDSLGLDKAECVDDDFSFHGLDWVNNDSD